MATTGLAQDIHLQEGLGAQVAAWLGRSGEEPDSVEILDQVDIGSGNRGVIVRARSAGEANSYVLVSADREGSDIWPIDTLLATTWEFDFVEQDEIVIATTSGYGPTYYEQYFIDPIRRVVLKHRQFTNPKPQTVLVARDTLFAAVRFQSLDSDGQTARPATFFVATAVQGDSVIAEELYRSEPVQTIEMVRDTIFVITETTEMFRARGNWVGRDRRLPLIEPPPGVRFLHRRLPQFRIRDRGIEETRLEDTLFVPLNLPDLDMFRRRRPDRYSSFEPEILVRIGPVAVHESRAWFGLDFYDGEGMSGVGGIGWFDPDTRTAEILYPDALVDWSVSALAGYGRRLLIARASFGEGSSASGGVGTYDVEADSFEVIAEPPGIVGAFAVSDETVYALSDHGILRIERGVHTYFRALPGPKDRSLRFVRLPFEN